MRSRAGGAPPWAARARAELRSRLLAGAAAPYPCHFATDGEREGDNHLTYLVEPIGPAGVEGLAAALLAYLSPETAPGERRRSLIAFVGPPRPATWQEHHDRFWQVLRLLRGADPLPWPASVPSDCGNPRWELCFAGQPLFVFGLSPAYRLRRSRNVGPCLALVFQSRRVFAGIGGETPAGRAAKAAIRRRLLAYDRAAPHEALGAAEHSSAFKWRQYFLPDGDGPGEATCPLAAPA